MLTLISIVGKDRDRRGAARRGAAWKCSVNGKGHVAPQRIVDELVAPLADRSRHIKKNTSRSPRSCNPLADRC